MSEFMNSTEVNFNYTGPPAADLKKMTLNKVTNYNENQFVQLTL